MTGELAVANLEMLSHFLYGKVLENGSYTLARPILEVSFGSLL
jgi:hypothetical protein